jgi:hypothetical protein
VDCNGGVLIIWCKAAERPAVRCSDWLDLGRAIQLSDILILSLALNPDSETTESKEAHQHENAACNERRLPNGILAAEEYADETDDETDNADANV